MRRIREVSIFGIYIMIAGAMIGAVLYIVLKPDIVTNVPHVFAPISYFVLAILFAALILMIFSHIVSAMRRPLKTPYLAIMLPTIILLYILQFAEQFKSLGLYSTHCLPSDTACPSTVIHNGATSIYFSIITLTTIGYGDFIPATPMCRAFAAAEALTGYFFMALVIAILVNRLNVKAEGGK